MSSLTTSALNRFRRAFGLPVPLSEHHSRVADRLDALSQDAGSRLPSRRVI